MTIDILTLVSDEDRRASLPALAALRIAVFRDWPYLYDGSDEYEASYLEEFCSVPGSVLVIARAEGHIVGAATAAPMAGQPESVRAPIEAQGLSTDQLFYFGESVLLPEFRGMRIGHHFFNARETAARDAGADACCFCAVIRPSDHPLLPEQPRDLRPFWLSRGYSPVAGLTATLGWKDIDQTEETAHSLQFWMRDL